MGNKSGQWQARSKRELNQKDLKGFLKYFVKFGINPH